MISSAMSWVNAKKQYEEVEEEDEGEDASNAADKPFNKPRPYEPLTEEMAPRRKAHPHFQELLEVEKRVKKSQNKLLKPLVVFSGLMYGEGERVLHPWFKAAWQDANALQVAGDGYNYIPMIHVRDLAAIVEKMAVSPPEIDEEDKSSAYLFAVDESQITQSQLIGAIAKEFGAPQLDHIAEPESATQVPNADLLGGVDLKFALGKVEAFEELEWHCKEGFVAKIKTVRREFEKARNLDALRITVLGSPGVGKSFYSAKLAAYYKIPHILIKDTIEEFFAQTTELQQEVDRLTPPKKEKKIKSEEDGEDAEEEPEEEEEVDENSPLQKAKRRLKKITDLQTNVDDDGRYKDEVLAKVFKWKLAQRKCRNQGWIVDGFPKTVKQCQLLMKKQAGVDVDGEEEGEDAEEPEEDEEGAAGRADPLCMPEYIIQLNVSDDTLLEKRLMNLPQEQVEGTHNNRDDFTRRLKLYKEHNKYDETGVLANLEELIRADEVQPITREIHLKSLEQDPQEVFDEMINFVGKPHNYGVTQMEIEAELQKQREIEAEVQERARAEQEALAEKVSRERAERARQLKEEQEQLEAIKKQEQELLDVRSIPLRNYLMENVLPVLTEGLKEVCRMKPDDPVDYLAEYLFTNNSQNLKGER